MKKKFLVLLSVAAFIAASMTFAVGCGGKPEHTHTWATEWTSDGTNHWHACTGEGCDAKSDEAACSGGTATCVDKATCDVCKNAYGELDAANHTKTTFTYESDGDGTHTKKHECCGAVAAAAEECSGGTATCTTKAVCEHCGGKHGEVDLTNHTKTTFTYESDGDGTHTKKHECCGAVAAAAEECSGGTATCTTKAVCEHCGGKHGEVDLTNHTKTTFTYESDGDGTHTKKHECCGTVAVAAEACSGGAATVCGEKATCEHCGGKYGDPLAHVWATEWTSDGTNHWHACTREDCTAKNNEAACSGGTATCVDKAICEVCENAHGEVDLTNHTQTTFTYESNGNGTHTKKHECCGTVAVAAEACSGGTATCTTKAVCEHCGAAYGEVDPANHTWGAGYDTSDPEYDYKKCECGEVDTDKAHAFKKTTNNLNQQLDMTAETVSIDLTGVGAYASVKSITLVGSEALDLGTNVEEIDFADVKADPTKHGAKTVKVVVTGADGADHEISVPVILVTKKIASDADLKAALRDNPVTEGNAKYIYGYFSLEADFQYTGISPTTNFKGSFEGNNHTITIANLNNGVFGDLYKNAVVRNLTIKATVTQNYDNRYKAVLAASIYDTGVTVENLTVIYEGGTDSSDVYGGGFITRSESKSATFKNLVVKAAGKKIGSLFGTKLNSVTFENCTVIADEVNCLAAQFKDGAVVEGSRVEINSVSETEIKFILGSQELALNKSGSIDLKGLDNGRTVGAIKVGGEQIGTSLSVDDITDTFKNNAKAHGKNTVTVEFTDGTSVAVGVLFVTAEITADEQLKTLFRNGLGDPRQDLYGYYVLGDNITYTGNRNYIEFYGTFDGKGKTVTTSNVANGLFTYIKGGAIVKNLTINATTSMPSYGCVIASEINSATVEDVTVNYVGGNDSATIEANRGFLTREGVKGATFKNLVVNAGGKKIGSLFGTSYERVTYVGNCSVTAAELGCVVCDSSGAVSVKPTDVTGIAFNIGTQA